MTTLDINHLRAWIGRSETTHDVVTAAPVRALSATLDRDDPLAREGDGLPPLWHWLYFLPAYRQSAIGPDRHAKRGGFLPPVPLPRRMWAGSQLEWVAPLRVGQRLTRTSRIADVRLKEGRTGALVFVKVAHEIGDGTTVAVREWHDIVYRDLVPAGEAPAAGEAPPPVKAPPTGEAPRVGVPAPIDATWSRRIAPDDVLLFRYSALTFNGHRIHYDRRYVTEVEGYPGLVVHGPLIATLLLDLVRRECPRARVTNFAFKAIQPIFDIAPFDVCGAPDGASGVKLWARTPEGHVAMDASATLA